MVCTRRPRPLPPLFVGQAQLAIAWCLRNPNVSSVILGGTSVHQLRENLRALDVVHKITPEVLETINSVLQ